MGYRLHASIPNVEYVEKDLELGKQYNVRWDYLNNKYFGRDSDGGMLEPYMFGEFLRDIELINAEIANHNEGYSLYNIEKLEKMFEFAKENNYYVYFESFR